MRGIFYAMALLASIAATDLAAQALPTPPPPMATDTERELAKIDNVVQIMAQAKSWYDEGDLRRYTYALQRLVELRPYNGAFMFKLAQAYAERDMKTPTYDLLLKMQQQGLAYDPSGVPAFDPVSKTNAYKYIVEALQLNAKPWGQGGVATTVDSNIELLESLAYDAKSKRFLMGSARTGQILAVGADGKSEVLIAPKPGEWWGVVALAVDQQRGSLWVASTMLPHFAEFDRGQLGRGVIVRLDLASGKLLQRFELPGDGKPHLVGGLSVAGKTGNLYAADGVSSQLYRVKGETIEPLVALPASINLRGIAVDPDERFVYLSDYELGLLAADLTRNKVIALTLSNQNFGGVEHLSWFENSLIAVQNVNLPKRIVRIALAEDGASITRVMPLDANQPALSEPTVGTLVGTDFYLIANSQRDSYGPEGRLLEGAKAERRKLYKLSANFGADLVPPTPILAPRPESAKGN